MQNLAKLAPSDELVGVEENPTVFETAVEFQTVAVARQRDRARRVAIAELALVALVVLSLLVMTVAHA